MSPLALKCILRPLIIQVKFCFTQMNAFSLKCALCTLQSLMSYVFDLKSHSMYSHKPFHPQGIQTIVFFNSKHLTQLEACINMVSFLLNSYYMIGTHSLILHTLTCTCLYVQRVAVPVASL